MDQALRVTLVANAGLLLEYGGVTLLLDGIFDGSGHSFSAPAPDVWQGMLTGAAPFERIDCLLFTHCHPDHLNCDMLRTYLAHRSVKGVFLPDTELVRDSGLPEDLRAHGTPAVLLSEATDRAVYRIAPEVTVQAFRTRHLDKCYAQVEHFCYLLTFGEKRVLFTADMDYVSEDLSVLGERRLRAVFVNPLFFTALRTGRFFRGTLHTDEICVYHVPFAEDDADAMRSHLRYGMDRWDADKPAVSALTEPFQHILL